MSTERLIADKTQYSDNGTHRHLPRSCSSSSPLIPRIFEELPKATIVSVLKPETTDFSPMLLSYNIELKYKQFKWQLVKKASQVLYLHLAVKKRVIIDEFHEKQEQVKEWLHSLGVFDQVAVVQDDEEPDDGAVPLHHKESSKLSNVPSSAVFPILRPALGRQQTVSDRAKASMQGYLNHFLSNIDIVNSREVCKFLEVSRLSFAHKYGPKFKEGYVMVKHLSDTSGAGVHCLGWCGNSWQKVWAVLKPGFIALLEDPFDNKLLDIIVFDIRPTNDAKEGSVAHLADQIKESNPLRYAFKVSCGNRNIKFRSTSKGKVKDWVAAINNAGLRPSDGWCYSHRFGSFAPQRGLIDDGSQAQWFIDGKEAFEAIAASIEAAKSEIFITGWWLCPELYMKRPFESHPSYRLDALLEAKAKQGVHIYILLYKEVALALKINSQYSMKKLRKIHENVKVLRYPDHLATGVYLWSHHEKLVIIDYRICFIGGLDLCFGRYDTVEHQVGDCPPRIWPGKDYYNPRESEPNSWEEMMKDELDREKYPRMPWHDVHCALWGPPCRDVARHFVQRWNHAKRSKAPNEHAIPLLIPHHHMVLPHYMPRSEQIDIHNKNTDQNPKDLNMEDMVSSESPLEDIPLLLPQETDKLVESDSDLNGLSRMANHPDKPFGLIEDRLISSENYQDNALFPDMQLSGLLDGIHSADPQNEENSHLVARMLSDDYWKSVEEDSNDIYTIEFGEIGPRMACSCQVIRSVSEWSAGTSQTEDSIHTAYCSLIDNAQHFIYIENQFFISGLSGDETIQNRVLEALYRRILRAHKEQKCFRVIVVIPLIPGFQGGIDDGGAATVRALMHWQYRTISREKTSILHHLNLLLGPKTEDYITFCGLRTYGRLSNDGLVATSQVYVHSKVMIIDDRIAFIGSSNINDRSLLGSRDSEIGVLIEDKEFTDTSMSGQPWKAGKFSYTLRCSLWSEHLGLQRNEVFKISDPVSDLTYKDLWLATAKYNTMIYQDVFDCIPNEHIHSRAALRQCMSERKLKHDTIDLGIAAEKLETYENGENRLTDTMERLKFVRGHVVSFPLEFMCQEDLRPVFNESEFYASPQVFH